MPPLSTAATLGASTAAGHRAARIAPALLPAFRVDVSRYPQVGLVVTVPAGGPSLTSSDFSVMVGTRTVQPSLRYLSPGDIQLVLAPAMGGTTALAEQGPAAASFLVNLPRGAQTGVVDPSRAEMLAGGLTTDPTTSVAGAVAPAGGAPEPAAARLTTALSAFSPGVQVRRTVVLVIGADETLSRAASWHFRQQLAAGGTALYVLDASPDGSAGFDALAAASGGFAARLRTPADWRTAFSQIITDLGQQYYLRFIDPVRLPGLALIAVTTPSGILHSVVQLPAANPVAPPPLSAVRRIAQTLRDWPLVGLGVLLIVLILCYGLGMLAASRRNPRRLTAARQRPARPGPPGGDLFFVFLLPCLNEEKVILNSLQRLLSMPRGNFAVLVIDDDSDDRTVEMVSSVLGERAWLLQRTTRGRARARRSTPPSATSRPAACSTAATRTTSSSSWSTPTAGSTRMPSPRSLRTSPTRWWAPCRSASGSTTARPAGSRGCKTWNLSSTRKSSSAAVATWAVSASAATASSCGCLRCARWDRRRGPGA